MDEFDLLRQLGTRAAEEPAPTLDVRGQVLRNLRRQPIQSFDRNLAIVSLCACSLAAIAVGTIAMSVRETDGVSAFSQVVMNQTGPEALLRLVEP